MFRLSEPIISGLAHFMKTKRSRHTHVSLMPVTLQSSVIYCRDAALMLFRNQPLRTLPSYHHVNPPSPV